MDVTIYLDLDVDQELTRAALPQAVLAVLSHGESHGYAISDVLRRHGFARIKGGTLFPLLKRLEEHGFVMHNWEHDQAGPGRKQFTSLSTAATSWTARQVGAR